VRNVGIEMAYTRSALSLKDDLEVAVATAKGRITALLARLEIILLRHLQRRNLRSIEI
jgi:hypothetical protein